MHGLHEAQVQRVGGEKVALANEVVLAGRHDALRPGRHGGRFVGATYASHLHTRAPPTRTMSATKLEQSTLFRSTLYKISSTALVFQSIGTPQ